MKKILPVALIAIFSPFSAFADGCMDTAVSQGQMNSCAHKSYQEADKTLNDAYRNATARVSADAAAKKRLVTAQRAWIVFRDAECDFVASSVGEGSAGPMVKLGCLEDLTKTRANEIQKYLDCPEGDLSCPLPRAG
jgi:uncharacterized protein YecT (DUF1311 family)